MCIYFCVEEELCIICPPENVALISQGKQQLQLIINYNLTGKILIHLDHYEKEVMFSGIWQFQLLLTSRDYNN